MLALLASLVLAGCSKDTDCKGDRICEKSVCAPPRAAAAAADAGEWALPVSSNLKTSPPPAPPLVEAPPPTPAAAARPPLRPKPVSAADRTFPRVVRKQGQVCVQSVDDKGVLQESCRPE